MKTPLLVKFLGVLTLLAFLVGCESNAQFKESNLTTSGFKAVPAKTAAQQAHLQTLSSTKVTKITRKGATYYVYPDVKNNVLYVGGPAQYNAYKATKAGQLSERENDMAAQNAFITNDAFLTGFDVWGPFY